MVPLDRFLEDALLQAVAAENNLAETAFVVPSEGGDYRLRWFTPTVEVPLCGHATLAARRRGRGAAGARPRQRRVRHRQRAADGRPRGHRVRMDLPARTSRAVPLPPGLSAALGVTPVETAIDGNNYLALLPRADDVRVARTGPRRDRPSGPTGVIVTAAGDGAYDFVSRYFAPAKGIPEDPVTV